MPAQKRQDLLRSRRRTRDDADDDNSVMNEAIDDSQSDASAASDADDDADADDSDLSEPELHNSTGSAKRLAKHKVPPKLQSISAGNSPTASFDAKVEPGSQSFHTISDTEAMMNGLKLTSSQSPPPAMDFDAVENEASQSAPESSKPSKQESPAEKRRREHDEYKKKLETDPAFIPTRGTFFMHDQRTPGQNGSRPYGRGRGRGRMGPSGPFPQATYV
jgi:hypothetical protein